MNKSVKKNRSRNRTTYEIFEGYREEMRRTLALQETTPENFVNAEFVEYFERRVEQLDTLLSLYDYLISAYNE